MKLKNDLTLATINTHAIIFNARNYKHFGYIDFRFSMNRYYCLQRVKNQC